MSTIEKVEKFARNVKAGDLVAVNCDRYRYVAEIKTVSETRETITLVDDDSQEQYTTEEVIVVKNSNSVYLRSIGGCFYNNIGFDLYINKDNSYTVRPNKLGHDLPSSKFIKFANYSDFLRVCDNKNGVDLVIHFTEKFL